MKPNWPILLAGLLSFEALADEPPATPHFGLFVDTYYAFDANQPANRERPFTTLPTRHNEFALNLAYVEGTIASDRWRGRLALQTGTSVYANYASELRAPAKNGAQLADLLQHVQEAVAGYRIAEGLWIDGGIYFSHIGSEGFISRDNWTYTRSLIADFSPYYQAGVRLSYEPNPQWAFQLHVLNGWQNILETNSEKALGTQVTFKVSPDLTITHNGFVGRESELRIFQDLIVKYRISHQWETVLTVDFGLQRRPGQDAFASWYGTSFQNRFRWNADTHFAFRLENYSDPEGVIAPTNTMNGFQVLGVSANLDRQLTMGLTWRTEVRWLHSRDAIFPSDTVTKTDTVFGVSSLALSL